MLEEAGHARSYACPYHQWTFSRQGELLRCYGMQEGVDKSALGLRQVHVEVCEGLIFLSLAERPPAFAPARELMGPLARPQGLAQAKVAKVLDYEIEANWKLVWENNRECYHCNVNHPEYIKSNFDIYEEGSSSPRIQERLEAAGAQQGTGGDGGWRFLIAGWAGARFPDAERNIWYSANRTVLSEGYASESLDGRRVAPLMGEYRTEEVGVLRMRTLLNFWSRASCDYAMTTRLLPLGIDRTSARVTWLVDAAAGQGFR